LGPLLMLTDNGDTGSIREPRLECRSLPIGEYGRIIEVGSIRAAYRQDGRRARSVNPMIP